jgi:hypothetical protein
MLKIFVFDWIFLGGIIEKLYIIIYRMCLLIVCTAFSVAYSHYVKFQRLTTNLHTITTLITTRFIIRRFQIATWKQKSFVPHFVSHSTHWTSTNVYKVGLVEYVTYAPKHRSKRPKIFHGPFFLRRE